ncbi:hypothetical protein NQ318_016312 [Aromia moschata]|uniref:Uncharacterized protein n=1 Tax=Aromia moschata TaxID=1265417 RepID=A0AAV8Z369_9CUCU|nr:hypothetical protein NQ318_016312 [Aromia moschata]
MNTRSTKYDEETTAMDVSEILKFLQGRQGGQKATRRRTNDDDRRTENKEEIERKLKDTRNTGKDKWSGAPITSYFNSRFRRLSDLTSYSVTTFKPYAH